jgi:hypothetical protein
MWLHSDRKTAKKAIDDLIKKYPVDVYELISKI